MKKFRSTIILIILGLSLWAYLRFFDDRFTGTGDAPRVTAIDRGEVESFSIRNGEGTMEFKQTNGAWNIEAPVKDRADEGAVATLFTTLEGLDMNLRKVPAVKGRDTKELLKELGVAKGEVSIKLAGKRSFELLIGKETAVTTAVDAKEPAAGGKERAAGGKVYARIDGSDALYVLPNDLRTQLSKGAKDWRDRKLAAVTAAEVKKVVLKTAKGEIEAERKNGNWSLIRPLKARADNQRLNDLIASVTSARIEDFISDSKDLSTFGLTDPRATLVFHIEGGKEPVTIQIGATKKDDKKAGDPAKGVAYVKVSTRDGVVTVPSAIEGIALTLPNDLRDASLLRVQPDIVDRITLEGGGTKIVIGRDGENWKRKTKPEEPVNSAAANKLLNDLTTARSVRFVEDVGSDLKKYGLDQPSATVTLSSYSTEGTPESAPGDKPIAKLILGSSDGVGVYAKLDDEPYIIAVPKTLTEKIWTDPLQWQELKLYDYNRADIVHLEITKADQPAVVLDLGKEKKWTLAKGDGTVDQPAVQSLVNTLSTLRAVRWAGATRAAEQGLDKPPSTVSFTMSDKKTGKLRIGSLNADRLRHALTEGKSGTALLNQPDTSAFEAPLIESPKPAATVPPTTPPPVVAPEPAKTQEAPASESNPAPK